MAKKWPWFALTLLIILLDQGTKYWAETSLYPYNPANILPFMNWTLAYNTGAAFSFLGNAGGWHQWLFVGIASFVSLLIAGWIVRTPAKDKLSLIGLTLILGGALGNLIDRVLHGHVIDFIDVYYQQWHWPIFNVADMSICVGAFFLILDFMSCSRGSKPKIYNEKR